MPRIRFTAPFDFHVRHNVSISYKAGSEYLVKQDCAAQAIAAGKAEPVSTTQQRFPSQSSRRKYQSS